MYKKELKKICAHW